MNTQSIPLADLHHRLGARFAVYRGFECPAVYTTIDEEYDAVRHGCGLVDRSWTTRFEMLGEDRLRFLNGLVTCEVKDLEPGHGVMGFMTDVKGRILCDVAVLALSDRLWLELTPGKDEEIGEHIHKYIIADRVELRPLDLAPLSLMGPRADELLADCPQRPDEWRKHVETELFGVKARLVREPDQGVPTWSFWVPPEAAEAVFEKILKEGGTAVRPVGFDALERLRVEESRPCYGQDYGYENFPKETGYESMVSYTKGCYLGQEVVARIHYRGGVNRHLRGLLFASDLPAAELLGRAIRYDGRSAGSVTSAAESADGRRLGFGMVHKRAEPGATVEIEDAGSAEVVKLPF